MVKYCIFILAVCLIQSGCASAGPVGSIAEDCAWRQVAGVLNEYQVMTKELIDLNNPKTNAVVQRHLEVMPKIINTYDVCVKR